jgi:hypothetical protein
MLTTPSINAKIWKQAPARACLILLTLYVYYTPGVEERANVEGSSGLIHLKSD